MIATEIDRFIDNKFNLPTAIWFARLSDGRTVYQDDDRPGLEPSAWLRLKKFCEESGEKIKGLGLQFRSNKVRLPDDAEGYFFIKVAGAWIGQPTEHKYAIGFMEDGVVKVRYFTNPALIFVEETTRDPSECGECLIC